MILGATIGISVGLIDDTYFDSLIILPVFVIVVGIASYKYVGSSVSGGIFGLTTFVVYRLAFSIFRGAPPFYEFFYLSSSWAADWFVKVYGIGLVGFTAVGFIMSWICEKKGISRLATSETSLTDLESRVLAYIQTHNNQIQITDCALELGTDSGSVKKALKTLERKGKLSI